LSRIAKLVRDRAQDVSVEDEAKRALDSARGALNVNEAKVVKREARVVGAAAEVRPEPRSASRWLSGVERRRRWSGFATVKRRSTGSIVRRHVDSGAVTKDSGSVLFHVHADGAGAGADRRAQRDVALAQRPRQNPNPDGKGDAVVVDRAAPGGIAQRGRFEGNRHASQTGRSYPVTRTMRAEIELNNPNSPAAGMFGRRRC